MRLKTVLSVMVLVSLALFTGTVFAQSREVSESFRLPPGGKIDLKNYKGSITFETGRSNQVQIQVRIEPSEELSLEDGEMVLDHARVEMHREGDTLFIRAKYEKPKKEREDNTSWSNPYFHFRVTAPSNVVIKIDDYKSRISATGFNAGVELSTYKGIVQLSDLNGELNLNTYKGNVTIDGFRGQIALDTYKGDITVLADAIDGDSAFQTYKGKIELVVPRSQSMLVEAHLGGKATLGGSAEIAVKVA